MMEVDGLVFAFGLRAELHCPQTALGTSRRGGILATRIAVVFAMAGLRKARRNPGRQGQLRALAVQIMHQAQKFLTDSEN